VSAGSGCGAAASSSIAAPRVLREPADVVGDDREAPALVAGHGPLDRGVQRLEVRPDGGIGAASTMPPVSPDILPSSARSATTTGTARAADPGALAARRSGTIPTLTTSPGPAAVTGRRRPVIEEQAPRRRAARRIVTAGH